MGYASVFTVLKVGANGPELLHGRYVLLPLRPSRSAMQEAARVLFWDRMGEADISRLGLERVPPDEEARLFTC